MASTLNLFICFVPLSHKLGCVGHLNLLLGELVDAKMLESLHHIGLVEEEHLCAAPHIKVAHQPGSRRVGNIIYGLS